jgi:hypothetical protein
MLIDGLDLAGVPAALLARCGERRSVYLEDWLDSMWQMRGATASQLGQAGGRFGTTRKPPWTSNPS